jgi:hypothetical protein
VQAAIAAAQKELDEDEEQAKVPEEARLDTAELPTLAAEDATTANG